MKKINQLAVVAMTGLLGLSAHASLPADFSSVNIKLAVMVQSANTVSGSTTKFNVTKTKVINKDILTLVGAQFGALPAKAQLVLTGNGFYGGTFAVLNPDGTVFLANVSTAGTNAPSYELNITNPNNNIYTGQQTATAETFNITTAGDFFYQSAAGTSFLEVYGPATVKDTYKNNGNPESFKFSGVEDGLVLGNDAIVTGSVSGNGKNTSDF